MINKILTMILKVVVGGAVALSVLTTSAGLLIIFAILASILVPTAVLAWVFGELGVDLKKLVTIDFGVKSE